MLIVHAISGCSCVHSKLDLKTAQFDSRLNFSIHQPTVLLAEVYDCSFTISEFDFTNFADENCFAQCRLKTTYPDLDFKYFEPLGVGVGVKKFGSSIPKSDNKISNSEDLLEINMMK